MSNIEMWYYLTRNLKNIPSDSLNTLFKDNNFVDFLTDEEQDLIADYNNKTNDKDTIYLSVYPNVLCETLGYLRFIKFVEVLYSSNEKRNLFYKVQNYLRIRYTNKDIKMEAVESARGAVL